MTTQAESPQEAPDSSCNPGNTEVKPTVKEQEFPEPFEPEEFLHATHPAVAPAASAPREHQAPPKNSIPTLKGINRSQAVTQSLIE